MANDHQPSKPTPSTPWMRLNDAHSKKVTSLAFAPDGQTLVSGGSDSTVRLWDVHSLERCPPGMTGAPWCISELVFSPNGRTVAVVSQRVNEPNKGEASVFLWDLVRRKTVEVEANRRHDNWCRSPTFVPGGNVVALRYQGISRYEVATGYRVDQFPAGGMGNRIMYSPDGQWLVFGDWEGRLRIFDASSRELVDSRIRHDENITALAFCPDGRWLASASSIHGTDYPERYDDRSIRLWDFAEREQRQCWEGDWDIAASLAFLADNRHLISFHDPHGECRLIVWSVESEAPVVEWRPPGGVSAVSVWSRMSAEQRPSGLIATGHEDGSIRMWDIADTLPVLGFDSAKPPPAPEPTQQETPAKKSEPTAKPEQSDEEDYFS